MKISHTKRILSVLCSAFLLTAAGCSSPQSGSSASSSESVSESIISQTEASQESGTRKVSTAMGEIEVPVDPQRVVVNWYIGDAFTLDLNVVGYSAWEHEAMPFYDKFASSAKLENWAPEDVMKLDPDLIITYSEEDFDKFSKVAPVLVVPEGDTKSTERLKLIGEVTGHTEQAEAAIKTFETKLAAAKEKLQGEAFKDKTFSISEDWGSGSYGIYYETGSRGGTLVYEYLGLKKPEKLEKLIAESGNGRGDLSYEVAAEYFGDYMLWFRPYDAKEDVPSEYETTEIWKTIPAVQEGKVVTIPGSMSGLFYYSDVSSLTAQLDYIVDKLNAIVQ